MVCAGIGSTEDLANCAETWRTTCFSVSAGPPDRRCAYNRASRDLEPTPAPAYLPALFFFFSSLVSADFGLWRLYGPPSGPGFPSRKGDIKAALFFARRVLRRPAQIAWSSLQPPFGPYILLTGARAGPIAFTALFALFNVRPASSYTGLPLSNGCTKAASNFRRPAELVARSMEV